jgi:hypothetical protein
MIKKYKKFINESDEVESDISSEIGSGDEISSAIREVVIEMVENTIKNSGGEFNSFVESYVKNPSDVKIEGLINDSDIYEFYLEHRNDIDEILNNANFFEESPSKNESFGLYEYLITGTEKCLLEVMNMLLD